ncbi:MAG: sensor histidine kinase [Pseudomonadales bacterium]|jgi:two-component system sensor histidine kinase AlgZ|nr:sensor histidine kinase [Pseudomonadales bacterium]
MSVGHDKAAPDGSDGSVEPSRGGASINDAFGRPGLQDAVMARALRANGAVESSSEDRFVVPELCTITGLSVVALAAELLAVVVTLLGAELSWARFGVVSLFLQWTSLTAAAALCLARPLLARLELVVGGVAAWLLVSLIVVLVSVLGELAVSGDLGAALRAVVGLEPLPEARTPQWTRMLRTAVVGTIIAGMVLRYLFVQQRLRSREQSELRLRLQALQSRIRPHFLFNSMNIIASLIETDPETAEAVVEDLSELFRASLNEAGNQVPLQVELDLCDRYVRIEQLRLGDRLAIDWDTDPIPHGVEIPLLTLQPLMENAIYHGIQPLPEGGTIEVRLSIDDELVEIRITNPIPAPDQVRHRHTQGNRMALANIRSRLAVLYGAEAELQAGVQGERFVTRLRYPVRRALSQEADGPQGRANR